MSLKLGMDKAFNIRMSKKHWSFLKRYALDHETNMNQVIRDMIEKLVKKEEAKIK
jgi:hypothetical protein